MNSTASAVTDAAASVEDFFRHVDAHDFDWVEAALTPDCVIDAPGFLQEGAEVVALWMAGFLSPPEAASAAVISFLSDPTTTVFSLITVP